MNLDVRVMGPLEMFEWPLCGADTCIIGTFSLLFVDTLYLAHFQYADSDLCFMASLQPYLIRSN